MVKTQYNIILLSSYYFAKVFSPFCILFVTEGLNGNKMYEYLFYIVFILLLLLLLHRRFHYRTFAFSLIVQSRFYRFTIVSIAFFIILPTPFGGHALWIPLIEVY